MKGKRFLLAAALLGAVIFSSCEIVKGDTYIGYGWDDTLVTFSDNNPYVPYNIIVENQYYRSATGTYYASYTTWSSTYGTRSYAFYYDLIADYTYLSNPYGISDAYFYIYLSNIGPSFQEDHYYRSIDGTKNLEGKVAKSMAVTAPSVKATRENLGEPTGIIEKKVNGYTMHLEYWELK